MLFYGTFCVANPLYALICPRQYVVPIVFALTVVFGVMAYYRGLSRRLFTFFVRFISLTDLKMGKGVADDV